jgi:hypothetical protein
MIYHHHQNRNAIYPSPLPPLSSLFFSKEEERIVDNKSQENPLDLICSAKGDLRWQGDAHHLRLIYEPRTDEAKVMIAALAQPVNEAAGRRYKPSPKFKKALAALVANLLWIEAKEHPAHGYHGMSTGAFDLLQVGYRQFASVVEGMEALGYIDREKGWKAHSGKGAAGEATKFKAAAKLIDLAATHGITPATWAKHFKRMPRPAAIPDPVVLKSQSTWTGKGKRIPLDRSHPRVMALAKPINELNAFWHDQRMQPDRHYAFQRIFANGNRDGRNFNHGGRVYSVGDNYQHMSQEARGAIHINDEPTVELDIKASHATILHAKAKAVLPNNPDPYIITGYDRDAVKTFVTMTLGYDKFHKDWTDEAKKGYAKKRIKTGLPEADLPPFNAVKDATLRAIPLLQTWPDSVIRWGDLQFIESEVILETIHTLAMARGIPALPVHDSIIVPVSKRAIAEQVLSDAFLKHIGVRPTIDAK